MRQRVAVAVRDDHERTATARVVVGVAQLKPPVPAAADGTGPMPAVMQSGSADVRPVAGDGDRIGHRGAKRGDRIRAHRCH